MDLRKQVAFSLITVCLFSSFLIVADLAIGRFAPYDRPSVPRNNTTFVVSSPTQIHQFIPNAEFEYDGAKYRTNSLGFRDIPYSKKKPEGVFRVAVFGDSFIEGMGEKQEETIPKQLERNLTQRLGRAVQVMNCGVRGGSPGHYEFWLRKILDYNIDACVICVFDNDMDDDAALRLKNAYYRADAWWNKMPTWFRRSNILSYLYCETVYTRFKFGRQTVSQQIFNEPHFERERKRADGAAHLVGSNSSGYLIEPEHWTREWQRTEAHLNGLRSLLANRNVPMLFVYIPGNEIFPNVPTSPKPGQSLESLGFKRNYFAEWIGDWAKTNNVPFVDLNPIVRDWYLHPGNPSLYQTTYLHFNSLGLKLAAEWITPSIADLFVDETKLHR